mgnify:CR=1 FL=1
MESLNNHILEYKIQLGKGQIQKAYRGIMTFMSGLMKYLENRHPDFIAGALYFGYMDMSYFPFTPAVIKARKLKIAIVYLHEEGRFEVWLSGSNRKIQAEYIKLLKLKISGKYKVSEVLPGVDSIIESVLVEKPDFDNPEELKKQIEVKTIEFVNDIIPLLTE